MTASDCGSKESSVRPFPSLGGDQEGGVSIGSDELQRFSVLPVFVAGFTVKILEDVTAREIRAIRAGAVASQLADATDFYFASGVSDLSITGFVTRRATRTSALCHFTAASAECATTANLIF
jgi:hypothetical protein